MRHALPEPYRVYERVAATRSSERPSLPGAVKQKLCSRRNLQTVSVMTTFRGIARLQSTHDLAHHVQVSAWRHQGAHRTVTHHPAHRCHGKCTLVATPQAAAAAAAEWQHALLEHTVCFTVCYTCTSTSVQLAFSMCCVAYARAACQPARPAAQAFRPAHQL